MKIFFVSLFCIQFLFSTAWADAKSAEEKEWSPSSPGPLSTWTAPLCSKGNFAIQPFFFYTRTRGTFDSEGSENSLPAGDRKNSYLQQLFMQYGITDNLELAAQFEYQENFIKQDGSRASSNGLGDSFLFLRSCIIEEAGLLPQATALLQVKIPTAKYQHADPNDLGTDLMGSVSGGGSWDQGFGLLLTKKFKPFMLHADFIYSFPNSVRVDGAKIRYGQYLNYDFGVEYFLPRGFSLMLEGNGFIQGDRREDGGRVVSSDVGYMVVSPGIGWSNELLQALLAYQRTVAGINTDANDAVALTFIYTF